MPRIHGVSVPHRVVITTSSQHQPQHTLIPLLLYTLIPHTPPSQIPAPLPGAPHIALTCPYCLDNWILDNNIYLNILTYHLINIFVLLQQIRKYNIKI